MIKTLTFTIVLAILGWVVSLNMARACTDWKAVAAFDSTIVESDQKNYLAMNADVDKCGNSVSKECVGIETEQYREQQVFDSHMADLGNDRASALRDQCK